MADRMRPATFDEFVGQEEVAGTDTPLRRLIEGDRLPSIVLWGPPGSGKTTLARLIASATGKRFVPLSAVTSGVKEVRQVVAEAQEGRRRGQETILFLDEIHRFNKAQQDAFLPCLEDGTITLIGATTENPSFELTAPLLSRCRVFVLRSHKPEELVTLVQRAAADPVRGLGAAGPGHTPILLEEGAAETMARLADGDARTALNLLEFTARSTKGGRLTPEDVTRAAGRKNLRYDKTGEEHYNLISALHKSLRGSDPQASLYWLARMLECGEDPLYIARRLVRFASEDVGNADPQALVLAVAARDTVHYLGMPECNTALAQLALYLACAPKSNRVYTALGRATRDAIADGSQPVPLHIRNAPTKLMKELGYGADYKYPHDDPEGFVPDEYLPEPLRGRTYYVPSPFGFEKEIAKRIEHWDKLRARVQEEKGGNA